jgi:radical SAM superfamily enzyme YgiQ (UPF0313 family)
MKLLLINPFNPVVSLRKIQRWNRLNKYRVWKPLGLLILARLTPPDWEVEVIDENLGPVDAQSLSRPDLVGITAFTCQATRAYELAALFRAMGVPVVMGGIHATMCLGEALGHADAVVTREAESVWPRVLADVRAGTLQRVYAGGPVPMAEIPPARHDVLAGRYHFGSIQVTRGCPLNCSFCSVTAFNGSLFRHRPIENVIAELHQIREKRILFVDDNLIGTRRDHLTYAKDLFRAMIREGLTRPWIGQATINFADDKELLALAARSGCMGVFIGFESPTVEGLIALHKKFNIQKGRDFRASVRRIQCHGITVMGSFILGIDTDRPGIGATIARAAVDYRLDMATIQILTPLPGTVLFKEMEGQGRIIANNYPADWQYYTFAHPVSQYRRFTWSELVQEMNQFNDLFHSSPKILDRVLRMVLHTRDPKKVLLGLLTNLSCRHNNLLDRKVYALRCAALEAACPTQELRRQAAKQQVSVKGPGEHRAASVIACANSPPLRHAPLSTHNPCDDGLHLSGLGVGGVTEERNKEVQG